MGAGEVDNLGDGELRVLGEAAATGTAEVLSASGPNMVCRISDNFGCRKVSNAL